MNFLLLCTTRSARAAAAIAALALACPLTAGAQAIDDTDIAAAVEREYLREEAFRLSDVDFVVEDGIVTLEGEVDTLASRQQAEDIAGIVRGVRSVVNRLRLAPTTKDAAAIQEDIEAALRIDPVAESYEIDVSTSLNNHVTLTGEVGSWAERQQVERSVMTVPGVIGIQNELTIGSLDVPRGPGELAEEIAARLRWDVRVDESLINVLVLDGARVVLSGTVGSLAEKRHAEQLARVNGVSDVLSTQLTVEPWARDDELRRSRAVPRPSDAEISAAVERALSYDPRVAAEQIDVTTRRGVVELSGRAANLTALRAATEDARNTHGVRTVDVQLVVETNERSDAEIREIIAGAMRGYGLTESSDISVEVSNGIVRLSGNTPTARTHWQAEQIAMAVRGVTAIHNELLIDGRQPTLLTRLYAFDSQPDRFASSAALGLKSDRELYDDVETELFWSPFVDSHAVEIDVDDGAVTLSGEVDSAREYAAARENAFEAGALTVRNDLDVVD